MDKSVLAWTNFAVFAVEWAFSASCSFFRMEPFKSARYVHWTAGTYPTTAPAYAVCLTDRNGRRSTYRRGHIGKCVQSSNHTRKTRTVGAVVTPRDAQRRRFTFLFENTTQTTRRCGVDGVRMIPSQFGQQCQFSLECGALPVIYTLVTVTLAWCVLSRININRGVKYACFSVLQRIPFVSSYLSKVRTRVVSELKNSQKKKNLPTLILPEKGKSYEAITKACNEMQLQDSKFTNRMSGALYISPNSEVYKLCAQVYTQFAHTNPLHVDAFPSVCRMEVEVVSFVSSLHGSKIVDGICGNMTSGGTESILSAIRTSRDYMRVVHGVKYPEM